MKLAPANSFYTVSEPTSLSLSLAVENPTLQERKQLKSAEKLQTEKKNKEKEKQ